MYALYIPDCGKDPVDGATSFEQAKAICRNYYSAHTEEEVRYQMSIHPEYSENFIRQAIKNVQASYIVELETTYKAFLEGKQDWFGNLEWLYFKDM